MTERPSIAQRGGSSIAEVEIHTRHGVFTATAASDAHLIVQIDQENNVQVFECPSGVPVAFASGSDVIFVGAVDFTDVHDGPVETEGEHQGAEPGQKWAGRRVRHSVHGDGTATTDVDGDGETFVRFDKGLAGYIATDDLEIVDEEGSE